MGPPGPPGPPGDSGAAAMGEFPTAGNVEKAGPSYHYNNHYYNQYAHQYRYYRSEPEEVIKEKRKLGVFNYVEELNTRLDGLQKPDGSVLFPARSCKDLKMCFPDSVSGMY